MSHRISRATRWTVWYKRDGNSEESHECQAEDRDDAIQQLVKHLGHPNFVVTRVLPGWRSLVTKKGEH